MNRAILLRYHEVALKGANRSWFEERLAINARKLLKESLARAGDAEGEKPAFTVTRENTRVVVHAPWTASTRATLARVFGVTSFSAMRVVPTEHGALLEACVEEFENHVKLHGMPRTFRVLTRRSEKALPETSLEIDRKIGTAIHERHPGLKVALKDADLVVALELRRSGSYVWTEKISGPGGLPVGTNGRLLALMSGGLDSPVAAIKALRRGSPLSYLHFYGAPFVDETALDKVIDLVRAINRYQPDPRPLHVVHFGKIQEKIALATNPKLRTVLYRRMMIRVAEEIARKNSCLGLVTGESLGQVASQTLENLSTINRVATLPILRPLVTFDKAEIIEEAHRLGTFEISVRPAADCCTLFSDRHPAIRATPEQVDAEERKFPVDELVREAVEKTEIRSVRVF